METVKDFIFGGSQITVDDDYSHEIKRCLLLIWGGVMGVQIHYFANKVISSQSYGFSSSHVWMWEMDYKESWAPKNWCFWTVVLEKTIESPLNSKEIQPVHPKENHSWIFIGRTDAEGETPVLWPPDVKTDSFEKTLMLGKIEGSRRRGQQRMGWLNGITNSMHISLSKVWELMDRKAWHGSVRGVAKIWTQLSDWTELKTALWFICKRNFMKEVYLDFFFHYLHLLLETEFTEFSNLQ